MKFDYFVNENKGTVAVKADDGFREMCNEMYYLADKIGIHGYVISCILEKYRAEIHKIRGVARCSEKDAFNLCTGAELAKLRFLRKYEACRGRIYAEIFNKLEESAAIVSNRVDRSYNRFCDFEDKISDMFVQE